MGPPAAVTVDSPIGRGAPGSQPGAPESSRLLLVVEAGGPDPNSIDESTVSHVVRAGAWYRQRLTTGQSTDESGSALPPAVPVIEVVTAGSGWWGLPPARTDDDVVLVIRSGCRLEKVALAVMMSVLSRHPRVDLVYGDSILERSDGCRPELRPGFSPDRLIAQQYLGGILAIRHPLWDAVVGQRMPGAGPVDDHRRAAALGDAARAVAHIPRPLYRHSSITAQRPALDHIPRPEASVSVIIPTNGSRRRVRGRDVCLVHHAVSSIVELRNPEGRAGPQLKPEIVVVTTPGIDDMVVDELPKLVAGDRVEPGVTLRIVHDHRPFNFSNACNRGAVEATGDVLVFLNDDTEVVTADWLERLVARAAGPGIGAVGARLYYENGTIQHNGLWTRGGHPAHRYEGHTTEGDGHLDSLTVVQNCLAVTGACLAVRADRFHQVGGFSPVFPSSYNDVDLCLKLLDHGYRTVVDPAVELFHFEASSRDPSISDDEMALLHDRWRSVLNNDPFDNPNFDASGCEEYPLPSMDDLPLLDDDDVDRPPVRVWPLEPLASVSAPGSLVGLHLDDG